MIVHNPPKSQQDSASARQADLPYAYIIDEHHNRDLREPAWQESAENTGGLNRVSPLCQSKQSLKHLGDSGWESPGVFFEGPFG